MKSWELHRPLGIDLESIFIPLTVSGPNLSFESRVPTDWEMSNLRIVEITSTTWNPVDMHQSAPGLNPMHVVDCMSTAWRDMWSPSTACQTLTFPTSDSRSVSSLYANAIFVRDALTETLDGAPIIVGPRTDFMKEVSRLKIKLKQSEVG
jgi:hypothetical protein